jgi:hypothetical protein
MSALLCTVVYCILLRAYNTVLKYPPHNEFLFWPCKSWIGRPTAVGFGSVPQMVKWHIFAIPKSNNVLLFQQYQIVYVVVTFSYTPTLQNQQPIVPDHVLLIHLTEAHVHDFAAPTDKPATLIPRKSCRSCVRERSHPLVLPRTRPNQ